MRRALRRGMLASALLVGLAALWLGVSHVLLSRGPVLGPKPAGALRIATHNIHYIVVGRGPGRWSDRAWDRRKQAADATFKALDADIVAFQEMESFSGGNDDHNNLARQWLLAQNPDYAAAAIGDWRAFPSTQPVFYRRARLAVVDQGWFFFSDTPDQIYSRTFDGSYPAFASWVAFRDRQNDTELRVLNVHLDYASAENRRKSTALIVEKLNQWRAEGRAVVLVGDLNARAGSSVLASLEQAGLSFLPVAGATYHLDRGLHLFGAIDHIGHTPEITPLAAPVVFRQKLTAVWPSDHYPVVAGFTSD